MAEQARLGAEAKAAGIRLVEDAANEAEAVRVGIYEDVPGVVLIGLAAQELAGKLERIEHLNVTPDGLGAMLQSLVTAGTAHLERNSHEE